MTASNRLPIVAIVGRPNVGKSTLFNRFAGRRRALVFDEPGVTRDRIAEPVAVGERQVLVVDTAGLDPHESHRDDPEGQGAGLSRAIQAQAQAAVEAADAILFVVDGKAGLLPEDAAIANILRRSGKPLALAVNKIDVPKHADRVAEFYALGLDPLHAISAEHGIGAFDALEKLVAILPEEPDRTETAADDAIQVAVAGRPNVGKSSLVNRLVGEDLVVVSSVPGTTRDSVDIRLETDEGTFVLVDTAGLRRPGRRTRTTERGSALMAARALDRASAALLVVDAAEGVTSQDASVASLVREQGCASVIVANKWDQVPGDRADAALAQIRHGLRFMSDAPIVATSALTGSGTARILPKVREVAEAGSRRVGTRELNQWLKDAVGRHEPAMARRGSSRRPIKFFYATQLSVHPPTFILFCTDPHAVLPAYKRFLENRLRESFDFAGTPIRLRLRSRKERA